MSRSSSTELVPQISVSQSRLRRATCNLCRERKVGCDRTKPECRRCMRAGHACTYPSTESEASKLNSALQSLHARLVQAETKLREKENSDSLTQTRSRSSSKSHCSLPTPTTEPEEIQKDQRMISEEEASSCFEVLNQATFFGHMENLLFDENGLDAEIYLANFAASQDPNSGNNYAGLSDGITEMIPPTQQGPVAYGQTFNSHSQESNNYDTSQISRGIVARLSKIYLDLWPKHLHLINSSAFEFAVTQNAHQYQALKYAVALSGAAITHESQALQERLYLAVRHHLEQAEMQVDESDFLNLETTQALMILSQYEISHINVPRGILTLSRLSVLLNLMIYECLNRSNMRGNGTRRVLFSDSKTADSATRIFWMTYCIRCNYAGDMVSVTAPEPDEIQVPLFTEGDTEADRRIFLSDGLTGDLVKKLDEWSLFALAMRLVVRTEQHHRSTLASISGTGAAEYNFCLNHERLESSISAVFASPVVSDSAYNAHTVLGVLTLIITLSCRITLYQAAICNAGKAEFLGAAANECWRIAAIAANSICDVLLQAKVLDHSRVPIYRGVDIFIMPPLSKAAQVLRHVLGGGIKESHLVSREIRHSLGTICSVMETFKDSVGRFEACISTSKALLENTTLRTRFGADFRPQCTPASSSLGTAKD
ncbi:hypothetical protein F5B21DRAFT_123371 [Xylaria acuta]|nr:hypothetical protein F5B21DRAFT_123371 [Xylaria acuta]